MFEKEKKKQRKIVPLSSFSTRPFNLNSMSLKPSQSLRDIYRYVYRKVRFRLSTWGIFDASLGGDGGVLSYNSDREV